MRLNAVKMLGILITNSSKKEILEEIQKYLDNTKKNPSKSLVIYTPNSEQMVRAQKNKHFAEVLNRADITIPDSNGIVWASRFLAKNRIKEVIPGVDFMEHLVALAASRHVPVGLIGGRGKVAIKTLECLQQKYPGLRGWAQEEAALPQKAAIVFVALGAPKQEYFIEEAAQKTQGIIFMAVGGSFDILSGRLKRAPYVMRQLGLEWLWRLLLEPWRIVRQLALIQFIWYVFQAKIQERVGH